MALNSVNTNQGAMVALQNLNRTNNTLATVQERINTGLKIGSARDDGAIWAIAQGQRAEISSLNAVKASLQRAQSSVDVAINAGESISDLLIQMKDKALAASEASITTESRTALNEDFKALRDQIKKIVSNAEFNGTNMIKTAAANYLALANSAGSRITVRAESMGMGSTGALSGLNAAASFSTATQASALITSVGTAINSVSAALARLGTGSKSLETHFEFVSKLQDTLEAGVGNLVDADLAKESARLQALQTKQQLGIQALAIANSSSSSMLGLFR